MNKLYTTILSLLCLMAAATSCSDNKSYAELLTDENHCVNAFLAEHRLVDGIPADSVFLTGPDAPYYRIDEDSNVYMQVLQPGTDERAQTGDRVYFRYMRYNLLSYVVGSDDNIGAGNANNMNTESTFFIFDNLYISQSYQYGEGIQLPMRFLGYDCKVNLIIKSQAGPESDMAYVTPYLYEISYYKPAL